MASSAAAAPSDPSVPAIRDFDRDALHILPLAIVPLQTPALRRARLIKNVRLEGMVEFFEDSHTGSGQMDVEDVGREFGWPEIPIHPDLLTLRKLALLPTFDVYSLRVLLRANGIPVNNYNDLRLSAAKNRELTEYMTKFTRPLISEIYGKNDVDIRDFDDIIDLFRNPDVKVALEKLKIMASRLDIRVEQVPKFLEDYGDIFLSLSYYRQCLDQIAPLVSDFIEWLAELTGNWRMKHDPNLITTCRTIQETLNGLMVAITGRFENFDRSTAGLWSNVSAQRFRKVETLIKSYHTTIGGVLCSLTVKIDAWVKAFPHKTAGGPEKRAKFIMSEMRKGIEKIQRIEDAAPMLAELG